MLGWNAAASTLIGRVELETEGAVAGQVISIREVRLSAGAEFIVMICGDIMTMPGLAKSRPPRRSI